MSEPILKVKGLKVHFPVSGGFLAKKQIVKAVDGVDFEIAKGETFGLVGESGCGKSTTGRALVKIYEPTAGKVIFEGEDIGTMFLPTSENLPDKKRWIGYATNIIGGLVVNEGAKKAILEQCSSLLPIGILNVVNDFNRGEVVSIMDENNIEFARGMVNYNSQECRRIVGSHSNNIEKILGYKNYDAVITRDNITGLL